MMTREKDRVVKIHVDGLTSRWMEAQRKKVHVFRNLPGRYLFSMNLALQLETTRCVRLVVLTLLC